MTIYNPTYTYNVPNQFKLSIDIKKEVANILIEVPILKKYQSTNINALSYILKSYYFKIFVSSLSIMKHILYNIYSLEKNIQFVLQIVYVLIKVHWAVPTASRIFFFKKKTKPSCIYVRNQASSEFVAKLFYKLVLPGNCNQLKSSTQ